MRIIRISEEVWQAIASRGKFGETEDDVLRREFELPPNTIPHGMQTDSPRKTLHDSLSRRRRFAEKRMTPYISRDKLHVEFEDGNHSEWTLPDRSDKARVSAVTHEALSWAEDHGATLGQMNYIRQILTKNNYHITK